MRAHRRARLTDPIVTRRAFLGTAAAAGTAGALRAGAGTPPPFDVTFYEVGDPHYRAFDATADNFNAKIRANLVRLAALTPETAMPGGLGTVGAAVGVVNVGDLINNGSETDPATGQNAGFLSSLERQWQNYAADFGLLGNEAGARVPYPVFEGYGNHDQTNFLQQISDRIAARAAQLPGITATSAPYTYQGGYGNITVTGVHYAWKWGPVHFIQTNIRVGDGPQRYPCGGSLTFLRTCLENQVGTGGAPVMIAVHLPPDTAVDGDWPKADRQAFYDLARRYNVIGILCGHTHSHGSYTWRGPDNNGPVALPVFRCDALHHTTGGYMNVIRIKSRADDPAKATLVVAQRMVNGTWGGVTTREIEISAAGTGGSSGGGGSGSFRAVQWQSVNTHAGEPAALPSVSGELSEPRLAGVNRLEIIFSAPVTLLQPSGTVTVTGASAGAPADLGSAGLSVLAAAGAEANSVRLTFSGGTGALPDATAWRFTLNPAAVAGPSGETPDAGGENTVRVTALAGDVDGSGRVTGSDLNRMVNTTSFDGAIVDCVRADIDGDGVIGNADLAAAWSRRGRRVRPLPEA